MKLTQSLWLVPCLVSLASCRSAEVPTPSGPAVVAGTSAAVGAFYSTPQTYNGIPPVTLNSTSSSGSASVSVDPTAYQGGGVTNISVGKAFVINNTGKTITDLTVALKKSGTAGNSPTYGTASVGNESASPEQVEGGASAHLQGLSIPPTAPGNTVELTLSGINMNGAATAAVTVTPSFSASIAGSLVECSRIGAFQFSSSLDSLRLGIVDVSNAALLGEVVNLDAEASISALSGSFVPPTGSSVSLLSVHLMSHLGSGPLPGSSATVSGNDFEISGFAALPPGSQVLLVARLSEVPGYSRLTRLRLEAQFE
jgi:hypothetical protein